MLLIVPAVEVSALRQCRTRTPKSPHWLQWRVPHSPQKYPFPWTDPQTPLPASSLDPSNLRCQTASGSDPPFFHNSPDRPTHGRTDRSCTGKFDHYRPVRYESDAAYNNSNRNLRSREDSSTSSWRWVQRWRRWRRPCPSRKTRQSPSLYSHIDHTQTNMDHTDTQIWTTVYIYKDCDIKRFRAAFWRWVRQTSWPLIIYNLEVARL